MRVGTLEIQMMADMARLSKDMRQAQNVVGGAMSQVERSVAGAKRAMQALGVGLPLAMITDQVRRMTDQYTKLDAQLRLSTRSQAEYARGMADIRRISSIAQADLSATSMLYTRLLNVMKGTGVEQSKLATVTETVSFGLKAYGATAQEASSAALQLSQAMGANRLGGEEFRAVMEAMPNVMKVLADSMGVPLGELRALSIAGKITADEMVKAFGNPAIAAEFKRLAENAQTITGAWVVARNELTLLIGEFMRSSGVTGGVMASFNAMADVFKTLANHVQQLVSLATIMAALYAGKFAASMRTAWIVTRAHTEALAMNAAGEKARAAVVAQAKAAEVVASNAAAAAKLKETIATREALFATEAELVAKATAARASIARSQATIAETEATIASANMFVLNTAATEANTIAKQAATVATAELAMAETALAKISKERNAAHAAAIAMDAARTKELKAQTVAIAAAEAAEVARATTTLSWMGKIRAFAISNAFGLIGLALWGAYEIADHMGWIDKVFANADTRLKKLRDDITSMREIPSQAGRKAPADAGAFNVVPTMLEDAAKAYFKSVGASVKDFKDFAQNDSFVFSKNFMSKEQLRAAEAAKLYSDFMAEMDRLWKQSGLSSAARAKAALQLRETYIQKLNELNKEEIEAAEKARTELNKQLASGREAYYDYWKSVEDTTAATIEQAKQIEWETKLIGLNKVEIDALTRARENEAISGLEATLTTMLAVGDAREDEIRKIAEQIAALYRLDAARKGKTGAEATAEVVKKERRAYEDMWKSIDKTAHDTFVSIINGGKDAATRLKEAFKNAFFDWLYSMTLKEWIINVSTVTAGGTSASAMAGGIGGGGTGVGSWLSAGSSLYSTITGAMTASVSQGVAQVGATFWDMGAEKIGNAIMGNIAPLTAAISYAGAGLAGIKLGMMIGGDKKALGMDSTTTSALGSAIGLAITGGNPLGMLIGGALGGVFSAAFGRGPKQSGTTTLAGQFSGAGFAGQYNTPWSQSGGWFSSGRSGVDVSPLAAEQQAALSALVVGSKNVFDNLIAASGEAGKSLIGWTFAINRQVATEAQAQQLTIDMSESMGRHMIPSLAAFVRQGESLADTAVRMRDVFVATDAIMSLVGQTFSEIGLASMQMRSNFIDLFGGIERTNTVMQAYYQAFYTENERAMSGWKQMATQLRYLGIDAIPTTNEAFRALVEAQDLNTAAGQEMFATLVGMAPAFDQLTKTTAALNNSMSTLATTGFSTLVDYTRAVQLQRSHTSVSSAIGGAPTLGAIQAQRAAAVAEQGVTEQAYSANNPNPALVAAKKAAIIAATANVASVEYDIGERRYTPKYLKQQLAEAEMELLAAQQLPTFAAGGVHAGGMRLVGENGPEIEYTGPSRIISNSDTRNMLDNSGVIASVDALRAELRSLGLAISAPIQKTYKVLDRWNGEGMPEVREAA